MAGIPAVYLALDVKMKSIADFLSSSFGEMEGKLVQNVHVLVI